MTNLASSTCASQYLIAPCTADRFSAGASSSAPRRVSCWWAGSPRSCPREKPSESYSRSPAPTYARSQPPRWVSGYRNETGRTRCGASRCSSSARSVSASLTSAKLSCSRYRRPPWMSLLDRDEVPDAKSLASTSPTDSPRVAASRATPAPTTPPPTTST